MELGCIDPTSNQVLDDRLSAPLTQPVVVGISTAVISMAFDSPNTVFSIQAVNNHCHDGLIIFLKAKFIERKVNSCQNFIIVQENNILTGDI